MRKLLAAWIAGLVTLAFAGCGSVNKGPRDFTPTIARIFLETGDPGNAAVELPISGSRVAIGSKPVFTEGDIVKVDLAQVELGKCLLFQLTPSAARDLYRLSGANQGRRLVLLLNQVPVGARRIDAPLAEGRLFMFVEVPEASLPTLVTNLQKTTVELQQAMAKKR